MYQQHQQQYLPQHQRSLPGQAYPNAPGSWPQTLAPANTSFQHPGSAGGSFVTLSNGNSFQPLQGYNVHYGQPPAPRAPAVHNRPPAARLTPMVLMAAVKDQQCAEEHCETEDCGDEVRPPNAENLICGVIDKRPFLPAGLAGSTVVGAIYVIWRQFPALAEFGDDFYIVRGTFLLLYLVALSTMLYCALWEPGQLPEGWQDSSNARLHDLETGDAESTGEQTPQDRSMPRRAHKTWLYARPVRRYDHYCRWLTNAIGLLNHREFLAMVLALTLIGMFGILTDLFLFACVSRQGHRWVEAFFIAAHFSYSVTLVSLAGPILRLHIVFVARNETAHEWKKNIHYVVTNKTGDLVSVNELSEEEFNEKFDNFEYQKSLNRYDKGWMANCYAFWFTPRWAPDQTGDF